MAEISEIFGSMVFGDSAMREKLPKDIYRALKKTIRNGKSLDPEIAGAVANAMNPGLSKRAQRTIHIGSSP